VDHSSTMPYGDSSAVMSGRIFELRRSRPVLLERKAEDCRLGPCAQARTIELASHLDRTLRDEKGNPLW